MGGSRRKDAENMADILRVTTPLINKNQPVDVKKNAELSTQFPLQNVSRVNKPSSQSELLGQNNGLGNENDASALLLNLLKDPSVTVNYLKSFSSLEALIKLLPANNNPLTKEIEQMFSDLLVPFDKIADEMKSQENSVTLFKGEMFDVLRQLVKEHSDSSDFLRAAGSFLKALTLYSTRKEALGSVGNNLKFLSESLFPNKELSDKLLELSQKFKAADSTENFTALKKETIALLDDVQNSILFSEGVKKIVKMTVYNLSRYNNNEEYLTETIYRLSHQMHGREERESFMSALQAFLRGVQNEKPARKEATAMDNLSHILQIQSQDKSLLRADSDKFEKIIYSLLSSPCNFTPLLHFVLPVKFFDMHSFAEIWINNKDDGEKAPSGGQSPIHMLLSFEIENMGRFEMELFVKDQIIDFQLFCPPEYVQHFKKEKENIIAYVNTTDYRMGKTEVEPLERPRSLMDVFHSLPYKRTGVDLKI